MQQIDVQSWGLIPAHAGSTPNRQCSRGAASAHPRSRGEHTATSTATRHTSGSSPLTRGAPHAGRYQAVRCGLIPAHAGSTTCSRRALWLTRAHPRSRGEHLRGHRVSGAQSGSSPLTRGALSNSGLGTRTVGLIPAHAGSTFAEPANNSPQSAHPRSRGEHTTFTWKHGRAGGSSPLTRGALSHWTVIKQDDGLIPAHAGSTARSRLHRICPRAHPRSRGEHGHRKLGKVSGRGSSPLTRGARVCEGSGKVVGGSSPLTRGALEGFDAGY